MVNLHQTSWHIGLVAGLIILLGWLYCINFTRRSFWSENEAFYALGARSVLAGNFLLPKIYNNEYADKPPLFFWWVAGVAVVFDGIKEWTVRLANVIASLAILLGLYLFARHWLNRWTGLLAVIITGTAYEFWQQATQVLTDMTLTALLVFSWAAMFAILHRGFTWGRWAITWGCIGLGLLTKGPVALILSGLIATAFCWCSFGWRKGWRQLMQLRPLSGISVSLGLFGLWLTAVYIFLGNEPLQVIVIKHNVTRFLRAFDHQRPFWYYLLQLPLNMLPWSLLLPWAGWQLIRDWRLRNDGQRKALGFAITITAVVFIFFSLSSSKRDYYLLPLMPWVGLLIADHLWQLLAVENDSSVKSKVISQGVFSKNWEKRKLVPFLIGGSVLLIAGYALYSGLSVRLLESYKSAKPLAAAIEKATDEDDHLVVVDQEDPRIFYYLNEPFSVSDDDADDLQQLRYLMLGGQEVDMVVEDHDLEKVVKTLGIPLYLENAIWFKHDKFYIITNERKKGLMPVKRKG